MDKDLEKDYLQKLGARLRALRLNNGLTLEQLALEAEIELSQVHRIEKGRINPKYTTLQVLAQALAIDISTLLQTL